MPTYDYFCEGCNHEFDAYHSINLKLKKCPECGKNKLIRLVGGAKVGVRFKCKGFYTTDYQKRWHIV